MSDTTETPTAAADAPSGPGAGGAGGDQRVPHQRDDRRSAAIQSAAANTARHAYIVADQACKGDAVRLAELLFEQSKVLAIASSLLVDAGCVAVAGGMKRRGAKP